jgi:hypothetical protein
VRAYPECSRSEEMVHTADQPDTAEPRTAPDPVPAAPRPQTSPGASAGQGQQPAPAAAPVSSTAAPGRVLRVSKPSRAPRIRSAPRRTRVVVRKVGPLSVLKFSLLFYLCVMLIVLFAMVIVYGVLSAAGAIDSLEKVLGYVFGEGTTSTGGAEPIEIDGGTVFMWGLFGGIVFVVVWSAITVFVSMLYNLISDIIGGVEVTLAEKPHH